VFTILAWVVIPSAALTQTFMQTGALNTGRNGHRAITLNNGTVLITGGYDFNENALASSELYDPLTGMFATTGSLNVPRRNFGITLLNNGTVLVTGGYDANFKALASAEIYDPATGAFALSESLNIARGDATATRLSDGTVLIAGGFATSYIPLSSAEIYIPSTATFAMTGSLKTARGFATATALMDGTVLVAGGWDSSGALTSAEVYDPVTASFKATCTMNQARVRHTATLLNGGNVLVVGGEDSASNILSNAEIYSPTLGSFSLTGSLKTARGDHAATLLTNGTILVEGGFACDPSNCAASVVDMSASAEVYDPVSGLFSVTGSLTTARQVHSATLLLNGLVLVAGGFTDGNPGLTSAELYQPSSFTPSNLTSIAVSPANPSLLVGTAQALVAIGTFSDNSMQQLASVIWSSSDTTVATVTNDSGGNSGITKDSMNSGVVLGVAPGTAILTACAGSVCGSTTVTVNSSGSAQGFALSTSPASRTVSPGGTATFSVLLAPVSTFSGNVAMSCTESVPAAHCALSPSTLTLNGTSSAAAMLTIATTAPGAARLNRGTGAAGEILAEGGFGTTSGRFMGTMLIVPLGMILWVITTRKERRVRLALLAVLLASEFIACSGRDVGGMTVIGTPAGSYTITVTATSGSMSESTQLAVIVN
jgi:hypothetical protein